MYEIHKSILIAAVVVFITSISGFTQELPDKYTEKVADSAPNRAELLLQIKAYLNKQIDLSSERSGKFFRPDFSSPENYKLSISKYRDQLKERIGYPPPSTVAEIKPRIKFIGEDKLCKIYRVWIEVLEGVDAYGIYQVPHNLSAPAPIMVCMHGGGGNPELVCNFEMPGNYGDMVRRSLQRGYVTWSPQAIMRTQYPIPDPPIEGTESGTLETNARLIGTSTVALDIYKISKGMEAIGALPETDPERIGMIGLSFGGYLTLWATALLPEIKVCLSSCWFNDRASLKGLRSGYGGLPVFNIFNTYSDATLVGLICPRPFMIEVGVNDSLFPIEGARRENERAELFYAKLRLDEKYKFVAHSGGHEFRADDGYEFLDRYLK